jgi:protein ImuB
VFGALYAAEGADPIVLERVAREFSPRIDVCGPREITLDLSGLARLFGDARTIADELRRTAADRGLQVRVAIAGTRCAARLLVHHRAGITVIEPGRDAEALAALPLALLDHQLLTTSHQPPTITLRRWGLRTLGEFAALPADEVAARLGSAGVEWQRVARGEDRHPLVAAVPEERFEQTLALEWPIEGLEPLSFVLGRLMEPLCAHLERRDRAAAVLYVRLQLVTRAVHERSLQLPAPMRDARTLRTLALLDLESHPPDAAIDRITVAIDPTPGRVVQFSLLTRPLPSPEHLSTLAARLAALMGEGRCGSPELVDSWRPGAFAMKPFAPRESTAVNPRYDTPKHRDTEEVNAAARPVVALRRFRIPIPARVRTEHGRPVRVWIGPPSPPRGFGATSSRGFSGGHVAMSAGPWRTSGAWWDPQHWDRDEWDIALHDGVTYRVFRERLHAGGPVSPTGEHGPVHRSPTGEHGPVHRSPTGEHGPVHRSPTGEHGPVHRSPTGEHGPVHRSPTGEGGWFVEGVVD